MKASVKKKLDQLDLDLRELLRDLDGYSEKTLNRQPKKGAWSVFQIMHHLLLSERYSKQYLERKLSHQPKLKQAGIMAKLRSLLVNSYLKSPLKRKAPAAISGDQLPLKSTFWEVAKAWRTDREQLREYLNELPKDHFSKELYKHPFAGRMSLDGMLSFFQNHYARHKKQIYRTLRKLDAVKVK